MDAKRAAHAALLSAAGISADRQQSVLDALGVQFEIHARTAADRTAEVEALQGVIDAAENADKTKRWREKLEQRSTALPLGLRFSIFEYLGYRNGEQLAAELPVGEILERAKALRDRIQHGRGRPRSELASLLFALCLLFEPFFPARSVAKNGSKADLMRGAEGIGQDHLYSGPMLDLVQSLLDAEGVEYESRGAVGRELWTFAQQGRQAELRHVAGKCATLTCEGSLATSENWLCEKCRTGQLGLLL